MCPIEIDHNLKEKFREQGFLHIKSLVDQDDIAILKEATTSILNNSAYSYDLHSIDEKKTVHKILYPFEKNDCFLRMLTNKKLLKIVKSLIENSDEIVPTWEDILIKVPYEGIPVTFHQDLALQSAQHEVFSMGIYLHSSENNPVYYLPGTHHLGPLTKERLYDIAESRIDEFVAIVAEPGDVVVHNVKTIHYSETNTSETPRYTWYLEFRTLTQLFNDSPWDKDWILGRRAIFAHALKKYSPELFDEFVHDEKEIQSYLSDIKLRIPHLTDTVQYDMESPYNHFA